MTWRLSQDDVKRVVDYLGLDETGNSSEVLEVFKSIYANMQATDQQFVYIKGRA